MKQKLDEHYLIPLEGEPSFLLVDEINLENVIHGIIEFHGYEYCYDDGEPKKSHRLMIAYNLEENTKMEVY